MKVLKGGSFMISTQIKFDKNFAYSYDSQFDILRLMFVYSDSFYYDEVFPSLLLKYDEDTEQLVGLQILNLHYFDENNLKKYVDQEYFYQTINIINKIIHQK